MGSKNLRSMRRKHRQVLTTSRKNVRSSSVESAGRLLSKNFGQLEECILRLLRLNTPLEDISWLAMIDKRSLATSIGDIHKGHL